MPPPHFPPEEILSRLETGPARIASVTEGLAEAMLHTPPAEGEWSANDVLAHLRSCNDVWGGYIYRMVAEDRPTIRVTAIACVKAGLLCRGGGLICSTGIGASRASFLTSC